MALDTHGSDGGIASEVPPDPTQRARALNLPANVPFILRAHPSRWGLFSDPDSEGSVLLPILATRALDPGVGRVDKHGDDTLARAHDIRNGWMEIPGSWCDGNDTPDGLGTYVRRTRCRGGWHYYDAWQRPRQVGNRAELVPADDVSYKRWLKRLVSEGKIPAPSEDVREVLEERYQKQADRKMDAAGKNPYAAGQLEKALERLAATQAAVVPSADAVAPVAPPTRPSRAKKAGA